VRRSTIQARSYDSAQAFSSALSELYPEIHGNDDEGYVVRPAVGACVAVAICAPFWYGVAVLLESLTS
jgi:hypothetical protein